MEYCFGINFKSFVFGTGFRVSLTVAQLSFGPSGFVWDIWRDLKEMLIQAGKDEEAYLNV